MNVKQIKINKLKAAGYNPRTISDDEFKALKKSLETFGLVEPIVVNKDYTIIGGHQRLKAWEALGNDTAPCYFVDLNKTQEKKLNIVLNSQYISGKYDESKLGRLLEDMKLDSDYEDLNLDELEPLGFDQELDYSGKNKEINVDDLGNESLLVFKLDHKLYLQILDLLNNARERLECDTKEEVLMKLLSDYE